jgi:oxygen-dependent protoporphyrinogen oxidase
VHEGKLVPVPDGFLLVAPTQLGALAATPLFSWGGKLRMALDLVLPPRRDAADESLAHFVRRRLGREALERVAQPLVGGIYTADVERLSLAATMPRFRDLEQRHGSVIRGLRAEAGGSAAAGARYGLFAAPAAGMGALIDALAARLAEGSVRLRAPVTTLERRPDGWQVRAAGETVHADAVVLAAPAYVAADLVRPADPTLADALAAIDYASSATVTLAYRTADLPRLAGFGFVVPAVEDRALLACTYASRKFEGRAPAGHDLVRAYVGGALRPDLAALADDALVETVRAELRSLAAIEAGPTLVRVQRHPRAMPQYAVGHLDRVAAIEARVAALPGFALAGAGYRGVGIPDCVRSGEEAAERILAQN